MMGQPAARLTDMHVCPMWDGPVPHVGGPVVAPGCPTVLIGGLPAARVTDMAVCCGPPDMIAQGSPTVFIGGLMAARMGDMTAHGGVIVIGEPTVLIGDAGSGGAGSGGDDEASTGGDDTEGDVADDDDNDDTDSDAAPAVTLDTSKFPDQRTEYGSTLKSAFPNLGDNYEILGPASPDYNCIGHTLGLDDQWVNPVTGPPGDELSGMDEIYAQQGYQRLPTLDYSDVPGTQKVVVYATMNPDGTINQVTHGAIQDDTGAWTSKLGQLPLIRHASPDDLDGPSYGQPVAVYAK
jgi:type VI secretion system secreted protein VgrG